MDFWSLSVDYLFSIIPWANVFKTADFNIVVVYNLFSNLGKANVFDISGSGCFKVFGPGQPRPVFPFPCNKDCIMFMLFFRQDVANLFSSWMIFQNLTSK